MGLFCPVRPIFLKPLEDLFNGVIMEDFVDFVSWEPMELTSLEWRHHTFLFEMMEHRPLPIMEVINDSCWRIPDFVGWIFRINSFKLPLLHQTLGYFDNQILFIVCIGQDILPL
jgi:hypothetical protein